MAVLIVCARIWVRSVIIKSVGWDDRLMVAAAVNQTRESTLLHWLTDQQVLSFVGWMLVILEVHYGAGRHVAYLPNAADRSYGLYLWVNFPSIPFPNPYHFNTSLNCSERHPFSSHVSTLLKLLFALLFFLIWVYADSDIFQQFHLAPFLSRCHCLSQSKYRFFSTAIDSSNLLQKVYLGYASLHVCVYNSCIV